MRPPSPSVSPTSAPRADFRNNPRPMNPSPFSTLIDICIPATFGQLGFVDNPPSLPEAWTFIFRISIVRRYAQ